MNALAIDCAVSKIAITAKKDTLFAKLVLNIGTRQSERLLPSIDYVLQELELKPQDLNYTAITLGPGSFTGLRLGLSSLKALTLSNDIPLYGIPSLEAYAFTYKNAQNIVLSTIEAKEDEYYNQFFLHGEKISDPEDNNIEEILKKIDQESSILVCGPGANSFCNRLNEISSIYSAFCYIPETDATENLFSISEEWIKNKREPLQDYDGPLYIRKSEAELVYEQKQAKGII
ncbi:MAG: tRNA (adenosine(37)-N6)-threonylcarbamoyltransferase complex dimerization subunit type 1 TsaB [Treponema sp.]|nr:tRNA (adenosine(37)-N6)-threonylcarbamoyltransferase complex dimerization subunit type 1 TsaB [Treponema sp.]